MVRIFWKKQLEQAWVIWELQHFQKYYKSDKFNTKFSILRFIRGITTSVNKIINKQNM